MIRSMPARTAYNELLQHLKNVRKRFGVDIVKKILFKTDKDVENEVRYKFNPSSAGCNKKRFFLIFGNLIYKFYIMYSLYELELMLCLILQKSA